MFSAKIWDPPTSWMDLQMYKCYTLDDDSECPMEYELFFSLKGFFVVLYMFILNYCIGIPHAIN